MTFCFLIGYVNYLLFLVGHVNDLLMLPHWSATKLPYYWSIQIYLATSLVMSMTSCFLIGYVNDLLLPHWLCQLPPVPRWSCQ
jgi:hypothetical protein